MPRSSMARRMVASSRGSECLLLAPLSTISPSLSSAQGSPRLGMASTADSAGAAREVPDIPLVCQYLLRAVTVRRTLGILVEGVDSGVRLSTSNRSRRQGPAGKEVTVKYMFLLYADKPLDELGADEARQLFEAWNSATTQMAEAGVLIDCGPLQPPSAATTVAVRDRAMLLT